MDRASGIDLVWKAMAAIRTIHPRHVVVSTQCHGAWLGCGLGMGADGHPPVNLVGSRPTYPNLSSRKASSPAPAPYAASTLGPVLTDTKLTRPLSCGRKRPGIRVCAPTGNRRCNERFIAPPLPATRGPCAPRAEDLQECGAKRLTRDAPRPAPRKPRGPEESFRTATGSSSIVSPSWKRSGSGPRMPSTERCDRLLGPDLHWDVR